VRHGAPIGVAIGGVIAWSLLERFVEPDIAGDATP